MHIAGMLDRSTAPAARRPSLPKLRRPETEFLANGIELSTFLSNEQGITVLELLFPAATLDAATRQREGYLFRMLGEGTKEKTAKQLADAISYLGASLEFSHNADFDSIQISCLPRFFQPMLRLLEEIWMEPSFPEKEWKTIQETQIHQNGIQLQKTSFLAGRLLKDKLYSTKLDYGYSTDVTLIESIKREEFSNLFEKSRTIGPALALVSGAVNDNDIKILRNWLGSFSNCRQINRQTDLALPTFTPGVFWAEKPESNQTSLRIGQFAIDSRNSDSALFGLTLEIFGGYFGSRLMSNIREDKGWTYGVYAQRVPFAAKPHWVISCDINSESSLKALEEIRKESEIMQQELVDEEELEKVKNYMLGQFLSSVTNVFEIADRYRSVWANGTDFNRVEENQRIIREASAQQVLETSGKYLNLSNTITCLSGKIPD